MANRPCKADAGVTRIWQLLLPGTAFPACGTQEDAAKGGNAAPASEAREYAEARPGFPHLRCS
jgi:hypothetical protein